ncbi:MAG: hypothetical protein ACYDGR_03515 [Candidatus Dormibacteria bacterium]
MNLRIARLVAVGSLMAGLMGSTAVAGLADPVSKPYGGPTGDIGAMLGTFSSCAGATSTTPTNVGGVCYTLDPTLGGTVDITIKDDVSPLPVGAVWGFYPGTGIASTPALIVEPDPRTLITGGTMCGSLTGVAVPPGANQLWVTIGLANEDYEAPFNNDAAIACGKPSPGIKGMVTANFSSGTGNAPAAAPAPARATTRVGFREPGTSQVQRRAFAIVSRQGRSYGPVAL